MVPVEVEIDESLESRATAIAEATGLEVNTVYNQALAFGLLLAVLARAPVDQP